MLRVVPANATYSLYCTLLFHSVIHGVMVSYIGFVLILITGMYAYIHVDEVVVS